MRKLKLHVAGRVQGVGFRYTTKLLADQLGVFGTVKNEMDGSVTIEVCGTSAAVASFVEKIKESPSPVARVNQMTVKENPDMAETRSFEVIY